MQHLTATQEYYLESKFDISNYVFQVSNFESPEQFMEAFIAAFQQKPGPAGKCWLLLNLAEYLVRRNEKFVAQAAIQTLEEAILKH